MLNLRGMFSFALQAKQRAIAAHENHVERPFEKQLIALAQEGYGMIVRHRAAMIWILGEYAVGVESGIGSDEIGYRAFIHRVGLGDRHQWVSSTPFNRLHLELSKNEVNSKFTTITQQELAEALQGKYIAKATHARFASESTTARFTVVDHAECTMASRDAVLARLPKWDELLGLTDQVLEEIVADDTPNAEPPRKPVDVTAQFSGCVRHRLHENLIRGGLTIAEADAQIARMEGEGLLPAEPRRIPIVRLQRPSGVQQNDRG